MQIFGGDKEAITLEQVQALQVCCLRKEGDKINKAVRSHDRSLCTQKQRKAVVMLLIDVSACLLPSASPTHEMVLS